MSKKLYVGNLPYSTTEQQLQDQFGKFGTVISAKVVTDRDSGRSKGFGFVEMETDDGASQAIEKLNGVEMEGRQIKVSEANPPGDRPQRPGGGGGGGGRRPFRRGGGGGGGGGSRFQRGDRSGGGGGGFRRSSQSEDDSYGNQ